MRADDCRITGHKNNLFIEIHINHDACLWAGTTVGSLKDIVGTVEDVSVDVAELEVALAIGLRAPVKVVPVVHDGGRGGHGDLDGELADDDGSVIEALDVIRVGDVEGDLVADGEAVDEGGGVAGGEAAGTAAELVDGEALVVGGDGGPAGDILGLDVVLSLGLEVLHFPASLLVRAAVAGRARRAGATAVTAGARARAAAAGAGGRAPGAWPAELGLGLGGRDEGNEGSKDESEINQEHRTSKVFCLHPGRLPIVANVWTCAMSIP